MSKKEKYYYIAAAVVVVIVIIVAVYHASHKAAAPAQTAQNSTGQTMMATSTASSTLASMAKPKTAASPANLSYEQALAMYPYRVQFSQCQANINGSSTLSLRKGDKFMLDNRDKVSHVITADSHTVKLAGYGFEILSANVLGTSSITCDGANRATINVEP